MIENPKTYLETFFALLGVTKTNLNPLPNLAEPY